MIIVHAFIERDTRVIPSNVTSFLGIRKPLSRLHNGLKSGISWSNPNFLTWMFRNNSFFHQMTTLYFEIKILHVFPFSDNSINGKWIVRVWWEILFVMWDIYRLLYESVLSEILQISSYRLQWSNKFDRSGLSRVTYYLAFLYYT